MSSFIKIVALLAVIAIAVAVAVYFLDGEDNGSSSDSSNTATPTAQDNSNASDSSGVPESADYKVVFDAVWSKDNGHTVIPDGAHFSPFVAWTHTKDYKVFDSDGETFATEGVKVMAETGAPEPLWTELEKAKQAGKVGAYVTGALLTSPGTKESTIKATQKYRYITVVSMLAPSPDWFVAVRDLELFADNQWQQGFTNQETSVYDAGTDSGTSFTAEDQPTEPRQPIQALEEVNVEEGGGAIARVSVIRQN